MEAQVIKVYQGYQADLVGSLDASNPKEEVERLIAKTKVVPAVNQLEFHPWVTQLRLRLQKLMRLTYPAQSSGFDAEWKAC